MIPETPHLICDHIRFADLLRMDTSSGTPLEAIVVRGRNMNWEDISSHSRRDKDRTPKTWELRLAGIRVVVTRHIHFEPDEWVMTCDPWFEQRSLGRVDADEAKDAAVGAVREKLAESLAALTYKAIPAQGDTTNG